MIKRIISIVMMICLLAAPAAQAAPHHGHRPGHHPGPPPGPIFRPYHKPPPRPNYRPYYRPYYRPGYYSYPRYRSYRYSDSNDIWISLGAGLLIGSIISSMNRTPEYYPPAGNTYTGTERDNYPYSDSYEKERQLSEIRAIISQNARTEAVRASRMASELGPDRAAAALAREWEGEGKRTQLDGRSGLQILKVSGFYDGSQMTYTFLPENRKVFVRISVPELSLSAEESEYYSGVSNQHPAAAPSAGVRQVPALPGYSPSAVPVSDRAATLQYAGFEIERSSRSQSGHLIIREVRNGTAAYYAGIRRGDVLLSADRYDSRNFDAVWFNDYISERYSSRAMIKLTISRNGVEKNIDIQL